jgi:hypothetical protein
MQTEGMPLTINMLVGYNLMRARKALNLSQDEAADRLEPFLGARWSKNVYSAAERSFQGARVRQFSADEIAAFCLAFDLPVAYFFLPPPAADRGDDADGVTSGGQTVSWHDLLTGLLSPDGALSLLPRIRELPAGEAEPSVIQMAAPFGAGAAAGAEMMSHLMREVQNRANVLNSAGWSSTDTDEEHK